MYDNARQCAEVHREVRKYIQEWVKPGMKMIDVCETLENSVRKLLNAKGLECGVCFSNQVFTKPHSRALDTKRGRRDHHRRERRN